MPTLLFWNLKERENSSVRVALVRFSVIHHVDVLILAEAPESVKKAGLLADLNVENDEAYDYFPHGTCRKIEIYARYKRPQFPVVAETDRYTIRHLQNYGRESILIVMAHLPPKNYRDDYEQRRDAEKMALAIAHAEDSLTISHRRSVVIGDLNMNPWEPGVASANGLHAVMTRALAAGSDGTPGERMVDRQAFRLFYNPMWGQLGERDGTPVGSHYGTYYYARGHNTTYFWNCFDQILVRPNLLPRFKDMNLRILTRIGMSHQKDDLLLTPSGTPKPTYSDHLPLLVEIDD